jgi:hypothetical protein
VEPVFSVLRKKQHAHAVHARRGEFKTKFRSLLTKEFVRYLDQQSRAVPGVGIATASAAMFQVHQNLDALVDNLVACAALYVGYQAYTASVVFKTGVVKALLRRQSKSRHLPFFSQSR